MSELGIVLEGGGLRGIYTAGVLDFFLDNGISGDGVIGVSAGSAHAASFLSAQRGRSLQINLEYIRDQRYCGIKSFFRTGDYFGADFIYNQLPNDLSPFDYEAFKNNPAKLYTVVSNLETGEPEYIELYDLKEGMIYLRASASLPLISKTIAVDGKRYLDGGICDSIPIAAAKKLGFEKNIVILTRPSGFLKEMNYEARLTGIFYKRYPRFVTAAKLRHIRYNLALKMVEDEEARGDAFVFRPTQKLTADRLDRDPEKAQEVYDLGYSDAGDRLYELLDFIDETKARLPA